VCGPDRCGGERVVHPPILISIKSVIINIKEIKDFEDHPGAFARRQALTDCERPGGSYRRREPLPVASRLPSRAA